MRVGHTRLDLRAPGGDPLHGGRRRRQSRCQPGEQPERLRQPRATPAASGPAASQGAAGTALKVTAQDIAFDPASLTATANTAFQITFANQDQGIPHNIDVKDGSGASVFKGDLVTGPNTATYAVPALPAGDYTFVCDVHTSMTGTLSVK